MQTGAIIEMDFDKKYFPSVFSDLIGHEYLDPYLRDFMLRKHLGSVAFVGANGYGKTSTAMVCLQSVVCQDPKGLDACRECDTCKLFDISRYNSHTFAPDFVLTSGTSLSREIERLDYVLQFPGRSLNSLGLFVDDLDGADPLTLVRFKDMMNSHPNNNYVATISNTAKIPNPLKQRFKIISIRKFDARTGKILVHRICERENIEITNESTIDSLLRITDSNPRLILRLLEQAYVEKVSLSDDFLRSTMVTESMSITAGLTSVLSDLGSKELDEE